MHPTLEAFPYFHIRFAEDVVLQDLVSAHVSYYSLLLPVNIAGRSHRKLHTG